MAMTILPDVENNLSLIKLQKYLKHSYIQISYIQILFFEGKLSYCILPYRERFCTCLLSTWLPKKAEYQRLHYERNNQFQTQSRIESRPRAWRDFVRSCTTFSDLTRKAIRMYICIVYIRIF